MGVDREQAACKDARTDLFYEADTRRALKLCGRCSQCAACLAMALEYEAGARIEMRSGIFGGTTPAERLVMESARVSDATDQP